ncbi:GtrA-like protein [Corynebacterium guangdongense]|nr:GtrA-like protein [Corynebacterium guangdongense]
MQEQGSVSTRASTVSVTRMLGGLRQFIMFGIVGGSGTIVNLVTFYLVRKLFAAGGTAASDVVVNLLGTQWNFRYYHLFSVIAFLVANTWNYQLNRSWTFRSLHKRSWLRGFFPFLTTGLVSLVVSLGVLTLLMNPTSVIALPDAVFDNSNGFRTKEYWAQAISILVAMPVNFFVNKLWTFRRPKTVAVVTVAPR